MNLTKTTATLMLNNLQIYSRLFGICVFAITIMSCSKQPNVPTIEYQGEQIRLTREFSDYDDYKNSTNNISVDEVDRIEKLLLAAPIRKEFHTKTDFLTAVIPLKFPGYGMGGLSSADNLYTATIEIPRKKAERYITVVEKHGRWETADDFKGPIAADGSTVELKSGELIYKTYEGVEFRRKKIE